LKGSSKNFRPFEELMNGKTYEDHFYMIACFVNILVDHLHKVTLPSKLVARYVNCTNHHLDFPTQTSRFLFHCSLSPHTLIGGGLLIYPFGKTLHGTVSLKIMILYLDRGVLRVPKFSAVQLVWRHLPKYLRTKLQPL
jgi:hypothetical protein